MSDSLHIVCPACSATNRIPMTRRQEAAKCGKQTKKGSDLNCF